MFAFQVTKTSTCYVMLFVIQETELVFDCKLTEIFHLTALGNRGLNSVQSCRKSTYETWRNGSDYICKI
jgi:hypothetical protein